MEIQDFEIGQSVRTVGEVADIDPGTICEITFVAADRLKDLRWIEVRWIDKASGYWIKSRIAEAYFGNLERADSKVPESTS